MRFRPKNLCLGQKRGSCRRAARIDSDADTEIGDGRVVVFVHFGKTINVINGRAKRVASQDCCPSERSAGPFAENDCEAPAASGKIFVRDRDNKKMRLD